MREYGPEYFDPGNPAGQNAFRWVESVEAKSRLSEADGGYRFWRRDYDVYGRVDTAMEIGSLVLNPNVKRKRAKRIVRYAVEACPRIEFTVFLGDPLDRNNIWKRMSMQEFWESTK